MNLREAELQIKKAISNMYEEGESASIADLAMEHLTSMRKSERYARAEEVMNADQEKAFHQLIPRLQSHEPIQYIMNKAWFYGMELFVDGDVLIPRPETEELVDWIVRDVKALLPEVFDKTAHEADETTKLKILDVGTGSGCIALALKKAMPRAEVWGCDISDRALNIARRNGAELDIRVDFQSVDYLDPVQQKHLPSVDIVVSNPPYVPQSDKETMRPNVLQYEPHTALFVDNHDPLVFYRALTEFARKRLHPNGRMYMEIHENLAADVLALFGKEGYNVTIKKDMQGKDRMVRVLKVTSAA